MNDITIYTKINPIDILIECIKHDPKSMGLYICGAKFNEHDISIGTGCPYGKVEIMLNTTNKSYYIPLQCIVTFENNQMHVEAYNFSNHIVDKDNYYRNSFDVLTPVKLIDSCSCIDMIFRILVTCIDNFKNFKTYKEAEAYASHVISDIINSFKNYFENN